MDNFMDRLVDRMDGQGRRYDDDMSMDDGRDPRYSAPRGRMSMDYGEPDDYGYGRPGRQPGMQPGMSQGMPQMSGMQQGMSQGMQMQQGSSVGRKDLEELGRAVISAQKKIMESQGDTLDAIGKEVSEGFREQSQKIDENSDRVLRAIQELKNAPAPEPAPAPAPVPVPEAPKAEGGISKEELAALLEQNANDISAKSADAIHKEDVKLYKNVQAIVEENASRVAKAVNASSAKTAEEVSATLGSLSQLEKINELEAALAETKEEVLNRTSGLKAKLTVAMILGIVNFIGVAVLVAIAFGFL